VSSVRYGLGIYILGNGILHIHHRENLKFYIYISYEIQGPYSSDYEHLLSSGIWHVIWYEITVIWGLMLCSSEKPHRNKQKAM
jgi:hypothetical protein